MNSVRSTPALKTTSDNTRSAAENMRKKTSFVGQAARLRHCQIEGFTLIEVMIVVAIIAILAAIALPSYRDSILRGQLVDATNLLSAGRANMERYFQDNRTYALIAGTTTIYPPCDANIPAVQRTQGSFVLTCTAPAVPDATTYTLTATGTGSMAAFSYTVDQVDGRSTTITSGPPGWSGSTTCWVLKKGQVC